MTLHVSNPGLVCVAGPWEMDAVTTGNPEDDDVEDELEDDELEDDELEDFSPWDPQAAKVDAPANRRVEMIVDFMSNPLGGGRSRFCSFAAHPADLHDVFLRRQLFSKRVTDVEDSRPPSIRPVNEPRFGDKRFPRVCASYLH